MLRDALLTAATLVLVGGANTQLATAADLIRTVRFSVVGLGSAAVALPQFDPALGALEAVTIAETANDQFALEISNSGAGESFAAAQNTSTFGFGSPPRAGLPSLSPTRIMCGTSDPSGE